MSIQCHWQYIIHKVGIAYKCKICNNTYIYTSAYFAYNTAFFCIFSLHIFLNFD